MAKIIKVGSQNPTFTSQKTKKASPIHTHRNSNDVTNPFKFTNFEGKTLPFEYADVFEGFKPQAASKMRMIASSVAGSMNKIKSALPESIINFVNRVRTGVSHAWDYAKNTNISDVPGFKKMNEILNTEISIPGLDGLSAHLSERISGLKTGIKEGIASQVEFLNRDVVDLGKEMTAKWNGLISNISFAGKQKYSNMTVAELETHLAAALAEGGINE